MSESPGPLLEEEAPPGAEASAPEAPRGPPRRSFLLAAGERLLAGVGRASERFAAHAGGMGLLVWQTVTLLFRGRIGLRDLARQMYWMGVGSIPIVLVTGMLGGIVTSQQGGYQFSGGVPLYFLGGIVTESVVLELGPVMTAIVLIGRVGARITAELGTMQVSEQIDALHSLGRDPVRTLVAPRIIAGVIVVPVLVAMCNLAGILSGMVAAQSTLGLGMDAFRYGAGVFWHNWDLFYSLLKAASFGFVIPLVSSHMGLETRGGAEGVGRSTTSAVVLMTLSVLVLDALFPPLLLN
ncbi:MAG TPA: ABC transporter permease [Longimicrobiaceae bacterium]|nr:ABC transporter permease [Longimicrobiaceae bacterium]